jgi:hypothetical protein
LLLGEIGAADEANGDFVTESRKNLEDFRRYNLYATGNASKSQPEPVVVILASDRHRVE